MQTLTISQAFEQALQRHRAGRLSDAEAIYRQILAQEPNHADSLHHLGIIALHVGRHDLAANLIRQAIALAPSVADFYSNLGVACRALGQLDEAITAFRQAITLRPNYPEAHSNLGNALTAKGQLDEAIAAHRQAIALKPSYAEAHSNLGIALKDKRQLDEAIAACHQSIALNPSYAEAHNNLGIALKDKGQLDEAITAYRQAIALNSNYPEAHNNLGIALYDKGQLDEAIAAYRQAIALKPNLPEAHNNLGNAFRDKGQRDEAVASFRLALELRPDYAEAYNNLGIALKDQGRFDEANAACRRAFQLKPDFAVAHSNLIFILDLLESTAPAQQQEERRRWHEQHGQRFAAEVRPHDNEPDPERRLRVGYVSADFRRHSAYYVFAPVVCGHDPTGFEVFCYSGVKREDDATARLRQATQAWRSTVRVTDDAVAEQIRRDRIDILVDLSGHSADNRLLVFARKPAPVQVTAWGHATGTGMTTIDYFFADSLVVPAHERALYAEEVVDLPCALCYAPPEYLPEVSALPALQGNPLTYGCVNRLEKISARVIGLWGRILRGAPEARLLLKDKGFNDAGLRQQFLRRLHDVGQIEASRVSLLGSSLHAEHLKIFHQIDVGLDPFPQGGGVSTAEALWMGVPLVTLLGATVPSRISASILSSIEMRDWVAQTDDDYVRIALEAGRDPERISKLRRDVRERLKGSPFGDVERYTRAVEQAYREMWRAWCAKQSSRR